MKKNIGRSRRTSDVSRLRSECARGLCVRSTAASRDYIGSFYPSYNQTVVETTTYFKVNQRSSNKKTRSFAWTSVLTL